MSSGLDWERFGVITGEDEVCILPPSTFLSEKGVGIPTYVHSPFFNVVEVSECFWTVPGQSGAELPIFICAS